MSEMKRVENILTELLNVIKDMDKNQKDLDQQVKDLVEENKEIKKSIVMTREQINRNGRPKSLTAADIENILNLRESGESFRAIADRYEVSHTTIRNALKYYNGHMK